jgi:exoribonuclease R
MPSNVVFRVRANLPVLREGLERIEGELELPGEFPPEAVASAQAAAAQAEAPEVDLTDLDFLTIDPAGSLDLDQAMHISRNGPGFLVRYAIADVAAFVSPGGPMDREAHQRGETYYGADSSIPLHPRVLSEGSASLLPDQVRPAAVWRISLDAEGTITDVHVERALVRSTQRWDYAEAQQAIEQRTGPETLALLREVGERRIALQTARGGISLPLPQQDIVEEHGHLRLTFRHGLPAEEWNAQISLLTGMAAASLMVDAEVGLLRTLPEADPRDVEELRRTAKGFRIPWPREWSHAEFIASLDPGEPAHQAMTAACTKLLRGSGYHAFDGALPDQTRHEALAAEYAHVTAPLRRLSDRYATEICLALAGGEAVPDWVLAELDGLPATARSSAQRAGSYERAVPDLVEAVVLADRVGEEFDGVITRHLGENGDRGIVVVGDLGVEAPVTGTDLPLGEEVRVRVAMADPEARKVEFALD